MLPLAGLWDYSLSLAGAYGSLPTEFHMNDFGVSRDVGLFRWAQFRFLGINAELIADRG
jgi:hypothetical protein